MARKFIQLIIDKQVAHVILNRPEKCNALNFDMFRELDEVIREIKRDCSIHGVILSGSDGNFSSGLDVKSVINSPIQAVKLLFKWLPGNANLAQRVSIGWRRLPVPVIAVLDGVCFGGGMQIALGADFRIASRDAELSIMEAKWGLVPDMAGLVSLREVVSRDQALMLTMTAGVLSAQDALSKGLVTEVVDDPMARAVELAAVLAKTSPDANAAIKMSINNSWSSSIRSLLSRESISQIRLLVGKNRLIAAKRQTSEPDKAYKDRQARW
ncbi:enoyl-CoA hydratase/carnithine racemase [Shewanella psychrophila]|uniref:Enoyl-CoA hydratase/carnithine racemase n=1 Tax=Shewanella psychrophila TaxID=225848 RepID=A0A1S6HXU3_9GAMM|nr:crotonase/enoyl-CoA hydratase family protein [Shewanella psychrophila]AQS40353.1 enoyl-CoA hydratase/carnithine racemase [Shewanella psychrophila]